MKEKLNILNKKGFTILFVLLSFCNAVFAEGVLPSGTREVDIVNELKAIISNAKDSDAGLAVSVFKNDKTIFESYSGFGNKENNYKIDKDAVFEWGSITKLLVWVSIMQLNEEGKLDLDQDIRDILPKGFFTKLKYDEPITIIHLMNHSSGWQDVIIGLFSLPENITNLEDGLIAMEPPQIERPGVISSYSNWGVSLAALIVEKISGMPYNEYVDEHIFKPLEIKHTSLLPFCKDNEWVKEAREKMAGYDIEGKLMDMADLGVTLYPSGQATGTLEDITRFAKALTDKSDRQKLFKKPATLELFYKPTMTLKEYGIALNSHGMWAANYKVIALGHAGGTAKFYSYLLFDHNSGYGCVILSNNKTAINNLVDIPVSVFGAANSYAPQNTLAEDAFEGLDGFYIDARTNYKQGFLKLIRILSLTKITEQSKDKYKISGSLLSGRIEKNPYGFYEYIAVSPMIPIEIPSMFTMEKIDDGRDIMHKFVGDTIKVSSKVIFWDILLFSLFVIAFLYSIVVLVIIIIGLLIKFTKIIFKKERKVIHPQIKRGRDLNYIASCLIIAVWLNIGFTFYRVFTFSVSKSALQLNLIINIVLGIVLFVFGIYSLYTFCKKRESEKGIAKPFTFGHIDVYTMILFVFAVSINILYWDLWRF